MSQIEVVREQVGSVLAEPMELPWLTGRRFCVLETAPAGLDAPERDRLLAAAFTQLDGAVPGGAEAPEGACVLIADPAERARRPALRWDSPPFVHAGYLPDGRQVRIAYFSRSALEIPAPPRRDGSWQPAGGYRIEPVAGPVAPEAVVELWTREQALAPEAAARRAGELLLVAVDPAGNPVGAATAFLDFNVTLRGLFWSFRAFVAAAHRNSDVGLALLLAGRDRLAERHRTGDRRGLGVLLTLVNPGLQARFTPGRWTLTDFVLVGQQDGSDIRIHPFPGAEAPEP